jgi:hypothetical protein
MRPAPASFRPGLYEVISQDKKGGLMTTPTIRSASKANVARAESVQDLLLISSFGFWAVLLGLVPVLAWHGLIDH